jgi:S-DNA-T family DNA segregation ATPase FtsK/SpoIIIE
MPHLLVAGSTGSGKSVMINAFIMSILLRATPDEVRFIMIDPKTVELGLYHEIPHLLTPVITDMKKASNALKNATTEMERRLKLLAEHGVRNIDQFNTKLDRIKAKYEVANPALAKSLKRLPYIVIIIDELADLMILEGRHIEEAITRLAQMARAVGIHLVLATQRPSVNVITGLIKANIPARMSFRLATGIDSRTILDSSGAEALLGRGDMLFLPPGTARMIRLHGPFVTEEEIEKVVREWKVQAKPRYDVSYLAPPIDELEGEEDSPGLDDPMYEDAVRCVLEAGKASTSTLQRRLRLGYGRAARILDAMEKDGIIGPPDGSRPRDVLKAPDWLAEVESTR